MVTATWLGGLEQTPIVIVKKCSPNPVESQWLPVDHDHRLLINDFVRCWRGVIVVNVYVL